MDLALAAAVEQAVATRFLAIRYRLVQREGDYLYGYPRTYPHNLGWRFRQNLSLKLKEPGGVQWPGYPELPAEIAAGKHDEMVEATWHDAASAEHWYRYEKDYGRDEPEFLDEDSYDDESEEEDW